MKIKDDKKKIDIEVETSLRTRFEVTYTEMAAIIGQFMADKDMSDERFISTFIGKK